MLGLIIAVILFNSAAFIINKRLTKNQIVHTWTFTILLQMIVDAYLSVKYHGPIFWGLIGGATGFMIGFMIDYIFYKVIHKRKRVLKGKGSEVIVVINCPDELVEKVEKVLWEHLALGVAKVDG